MRKLLLLLFLYVLPANANIVPNFVQGSMSSTTNTTSTLSESITSKDFSTGYEYTVNGTNLSITGDMLPDTITTGSHTVDGVTTTHYGIDLNTKPTVNMHTQGAATQLLESYQGPGLKAFTRINRNVITESVTDTMSTFTQ